MAYSNSVVQALAQRVRAGTMTARQAQQEIERTRQAAQEVGVPIPVYPEDEQWTWAGGGGTGTGTDTWSQWDPYDQMYEEAQATEIYNNLYRQQAADQAAQEEARRRQNAANQFYLGTMPTVMTPPVWQPDIWNADTGGDWQTMGTRPMTDAERVQAAAQASGVSPWDVMMYMQQGGGGMTAYQQAQIAQAQAAAQQAQQQFEAQMAFQREQLAQQMRIAEMQRQQQQREMAAAIGQALANQRMVAWQQGLPYALPKTQQYAPGFEPGGPLEMLYRSAGASYNPQTYRLGQYAAPSESVLRQIVDQAMAQFGPR